MFFALLFALQAAAAAPVASDAADAQYETPKPLLWQTLKFGMTPTEVAAALSGIEGIKAARSNAMGEVKIRHADGGVLLAGIRFKVVPVFTDGRLSSVGLTSSDNCANLMDRPIASILRGLSEKYGAKPTTDPKSQMSVDRAVLESYSTGTEVSQMNSVLTPQIAAVMVTSVRAEKSDYVYGGSGIAGALASLSNSMREKRGEECGGHGFNRADLLISYHRRIDFEAMLARSTEKAGADRAKLKNGL